MRGRKPKPLERQIAEGDPRQRGMRNLRDRLAAMPRADDGLPDCPSDLGPIARSAWDFWKAELEKMGLAFTPDRIALEGACVFYERAKLADQMIKNHGLLVLDATNAVTGKGVRGRHVHRHPAISISNQAWALVRSFCSEFGLSPVGRQRLAVEAPDTAHDDLIALLSRPRTPRTPVQ